MSVVLVFNDSVSDATPVSSILLPASHVDYVIRGEFV